MDIAHEFDGLVPVDFLPVLAGHIAYAVAGDGVEWIKSPESFYFKVVPTTDPNITSRHGFWNIYINNLLQHYCKRIESIYC